MTKKIVIGIIGKPYSGKETIARMIEELNPGKVHHVTFSRSLEAFLLDLGYAKREINRELLQRLAPALRVHFGEDTITRGALLLIKQSVAQIDIVDGVRWPSDFDGLRSLAGPATKCVMVYVFANKEKRFERGKNRKQRPGEKEMTWEQFETQESAFTESFIEGLGKKADVHINNNGSFEELQNQVEALCHTIL